jgi:hypothetical protein
VQLVSERLTLRPFVAGDAAALHAYLSREEAVEFEPYGTATAQDCVGIAVDRAADQRFLAVQLTDGPVIGNLFVAPEGAASWSTARRTCCRARASATARTGCRSGTTRTSTRCSVPSGGGERPARAADQVNHACTASLTGVRRA